MGSIEVSVHFSWILIFSIGSNVNPDAQRVHPRNVTTVRHFSEPEALMTIAQSVCFFAVLTANIENHENH